MKITSIKTAESIDSLTVLDQLKVCKKKYLEAYLRPISPRDAHDLQVKANQQTEELILIIAELFRNLLLEEPNKLRDNLSIKYEHYFRYTNLSAYQNYPNIFRVLKIIAGKHSNNASELIFNLELLKNMLVKQGLNYRETDTDIIIVADIETPELNQLVDKAYIYKD